MDGVTPLYDSAYEIVADGLEPGEIDELREWFCYTKPIGRTVKIVATSARAGSTDLRILSAGTEPGNMLR